MTLKTANPTPLGPGLTLPEELSAPITDLSGFSILLYGEPKCGKTSLAAEFEENLFLMFEPGARALSVYQREVRTWSEFRTYIGLIEKTPRFKTLTVDTIDLAHQMCLEHVCKENGWDHPSDGEYGKGWNAVKSEFLGQISRLLKLKRGVIFTSHAAEKDIKSRVGNEYTKIVPTMPNGARDICEALVDIWIYMYHEKGERYMRIRGNEEVAAGHRLQGHHFQGLEVIPAGKDAKTAYTNLVDAFNNKLVLGAPAVAAPKLSIGKK
jgi:hypothetical protein